MSVPVTIDRLRTEIGTFQSAPYLLTVSEDARPHAVSVVVSWRDDELVMGAGNRSMANAVARPDVSLLWPSNEPGGFRLHARLPHLRRQGRPGSISNAAFGSA